SSIHALVRAALLICRLHTVPHYLSCHPSVSLSLFFFYCYDAPLDLHSFPTRRSSDLAISAECSTEFASGFSHSTCLPAASAASRSEEHTSELQSRFDLVCRLLLEKKKRTATAKKTKKSKPT